MFIDRVCLQLVHLRMSSNAGQYGSQRFRVKNPEERTITSGASAPVRSSSNTPSGTPKSKTEHESSKKRELRLRPPPTTSQTASQTKQPDMQIDTSVQCGLQLKHDFAEDRALLNLSRTVMGFLDEKSDISFDDVLHSVELYLVREAKVTSYTMSYVDLFPTSIKLEISAYV